MISTVKRALRLPTRTFNPLRQQVRHHGIYGDTNLLNRCTLCLSTEDVPGSLEACLRILRLSGINMTRIQSKYFKLENSVNFFVDVDLPATHKRVRHVLKELNTNKVCKNAELIGSVEVPWFPINAEDVDQLANNVLDGGSDLQADHPGFHDKEYRSRRGMVADVAYNFKYGDEIQRIDYTPYEVQCWSTIWAKLEPLLEKHACQEYLDALVSFRSDAGYSVGQVPQLQDVNKITYARTGFRMRPCAGLLSSRDFLYGLAFRVFFSTQYLRHHSKPLYTPEPDLVHELVGHAPLFADPEFADFSQSIGLAAIGATDDQITRLARCYWFSVEFGLCGTPGNRKAYGAGLLSSFGEIEYSQSTEPEIRPWDPYNAAEQDFPITTFQPVYYLAESFKDAKEKMADFADSLDKPFSCRWDADDKSIEVDRNVVRS